MRVLTWPAAGHRQGVRLEDVVRIRPFGPGDTLFPGAREAAAALEFPGGEAWGVPALPEVSSAAALFEIPGWFVEASGPRWWFPTEKGPVFLWSGPA